MLGKRAEHYALYPARPGTTIEAMQPAIVLTLGLSFAALSSGACASGPRTTEASAGLATRIEARSRRLEERFRAGDMLGVANVYADDGVLLLGDERVEGREAVDAHWSKMVDPVDWRLEIFEIGGSEELAYERGRSHFTRRREGVERTTVTEYLRIWKKDAAGDWRIAVDASW